MLNHSSNPFQPPDLTYLNEVAGGNREMIVEIFRIFEQEAAVDLEKLRGHIERGETAEAGRVAHKIKGSLLSLGAFSTKDLFLELEKNGKEGLEKEQMQATFQDAERGLLALFEWVKTFTA